MNLKDIIKKQGGINLIKQYIRSGVLLTAISQLCLLGKNRTALEILRLSVQLKIKKKLERKYHKKLIDFDRLYINSFEHKSSDKIWMCWFQGIEKAPDIVKQCYKSIKKIEGREVILITSENMDKYVKFPNYIKEKWESGVITHTHLTDLLRLELLTQYGGIWLDATVYCTDTKLPCYIEESDLFFYQNLKPGRDGHCTYISSWLISAKSHNKILEATRYLCYEYWKKYNYMMDYFLLHQFLSIVLDFYSDEWKKIIPLSNATPHILLLRLFDKYDENIWNETKKLTSFHKLSYKFESNKFTIKNTFYDEIFNKANI